MTWLLLYLPLAAPFFAIWVGVPLWLVFKHPDQEDHQPQAASGSSTRPARTGQAGSHTALDSRSGRAVRATTAA